MPLPERGLNRNEPRAPVELCPRNLVSPHPYSSILNHQPRIISSKPKPPAWEKREHTNPHDNQKPRAEPPKIEHRTATTLHEIIRVGTPAADPVGERRKDVCGDDEEGEVVAPEGGGEDHEEETDGEDLISGEGTLAFGVKGKRRWRWIGGEWMMMGRVESMERYGKRWRHTKERAMMVLRPAAAMAGAGKPGWLEGVMLLVLRQQSQYRRVLSRVQLVIGEG